LEDLYKRICKNIKTSEIIFLAVLAGYLLSYLLKFQIGQGLLGIPLLIWYPGFFLLSFFSIQNRFGKLGQFSLSVFGSFNLNMLAGHLVQKSYGLNTDIQVLAPTVLCLGLFIAYALNKARQKRSEPYSIDKGLVAMIVVAILGFLTLIILNPLPQNLDNYLSVLKLSIIKNTNLLGARQIFLAFPTLAGKYLSIAPYYLVHYLYYFLFFVSTLFYLDFIKRKGLGALTSWHFF